MSEHLEPGPELTIIPSDLPPGIPVPDNPEPWTESTDGH